LEAGAQVVALVRDGSPRSFLVREGLHQNIATVHGALEDFNLIRRALHEYSADTVFHLAAQTLVGVAKNDPLSTLEANVRGTWNILEACRQAQVAHVVVASSDKAYGVSESLPYLETHPLEGRYPYDCSKSCTDLISAMYAQTYGLPVGVARCANIFGGGDLNFSRMIPDLIRTALRGERFVIRSDGKFVRDFLYVRDAAGAYMCLAENLASNPSLYGEAFNFSLEIQRTVLEIVHEILAMMGRPDLEPVIENTARAEIRAQYMVCGKARRMLGWAPRYGFREGVEETIAWYRAYFEAADGQAAKAAVAATN
jgi:CDP-glucose 4,6-dehydratase